MIPYYLLQLPGVVQEEKEEGERRHPLQPQLAVMMIKCVRTDSKMLPGVARSPCSAETPCKGKWTPRIK